MNNSSNMIMTTTEAAKYLGYNEQVLRQARRRDKLKGLKPPKVTMRGDRIHNRKEDLTNWMAIKEGREPTTTEVSANALRGHQLEVLLLASKLGLATEIKANRIVIFT